MSSIASLEDEAKRNFETQRYEDAAKGYEYLLRKTSKEGSVDLKKIVHYGLQAATAWEHTNSPEKKAAVLSLIGKECTQVSAHLFEQQAHQVLEQDPIAAANLLKRAAFNYERLDDFEKHRNLLEEAGDIFQNKALEAKETGNTPESMILFERAMECFQSAGKREEDQTAVFLATFQLAQMEKIGMLSLTGEGYLLLANLLESIGDTELSKTFREKANQLIEDVY